MARTGAPSLSDYLMSDSALGWPITSYPFSVSIWVDSGTLSGLKSIFSFCNSSNVSQINALMFSGSNLYENINGFNQIASGLSVGLNHIAWVAVSSTDRFVYVNGSKSTTSTSRTLGLSPNRYSIGILADQTPSDAAGADHYHSELGVWNVALSDEECLCLWAGVAPRMVKPQNLVVYAPLNGSGDELNWFGSQDLIETGVCPPEAHPPIIYPSAVGLSYGVGGAPPSEIAEYTAPVGVYSVPNVTPSVGGVASYTAPVGVYSVPSVTPAVAVTATYTAPVGVYSVPNVTPATEGLASFTAPVGTYSVPNVMATPGGTASYVPPVGRFAVPDITPISFVTAPYTSPLGRYVVPQVTAIGDITPVTASGLEASAPNWKLHSSLEED